MTSIVYTPQPTESLDFGATMALAISRFAEMPVEFHFNEKIIVVEPDWQYKDVFEEFDRQQALKGGTA